MLAPLVLIALLAGNPGRPPSPVFTKTFTASGWTLVVRLDSFSEHTACQLKRPRVAYGKGALTLSLPGHTDTADAIYRVDDAAPTPAKDDAMELAGLGFTLHADDLNNPSQGLVRVPMRRLDGAKTVLVGLKPGQRPFVFKVEGLAAALDAAHAQGCGPDSFY